MIKVRDEHEEHEENSHMWGGSCNKANLNGSVMNSHMWGGSYNKVNLSENVMNFNFVNMAASL